MKKDSIKEIWQTHIKIRERLIRERCTPIYIIPEETDVRGNKLTVTIDQTHEEESIKYILKERLHCCETFLDKGYVLIDESQWTLSEDELLKIKHDLAKSYVDLDIVPSINVSIDYFNNLSSDGNRTIAELRALENDFKNQDLFSGTIDDNATFIAKVNVKFEEVLMHVFGNHYEAPALDDTDDNGKKKHGKIIYENCYIDEKNFYALNDWLGIWLSNYTIRFKVNSDVAQKFLLENYEIQQGLINNMKLCWDGEFFVYRRDCKYNGDEKYGELLNEIQSNANIFVHYAEEVTNLDDIDISCVFRYDVDFGVLRNTILDEFAESIKEIPNTRFNTSSRFFGIDFNWRKINIDTICRAIQRRNPYIEIESYGDNHKIRCGVHTQFKDLSKLQEQLLESYNDIIVTNNEDEHRIDIKLPYSKTKYYNELLFHLREDVNKVIACGCKVKILERPEGMILLTLQNHALQRMEAIEEQIANMRKEDFGIEYGEREEVFGKLLSSNPPQLVFDINPPKDNLHDLFVDLFRAKSINCIIPILTGELEKISRLSQTFSKASNGEELPNENLQRFIFDSSLATKNEDIQFYLRKDGQPYMEFCNNLLNRSINESQKEAIIKAINAEDMAVIQGPPGTGKSTAIAELIWQLVRNGLKQGNKKERILLTSETNLAVDNAISRIINQKTNLVKPIRFGGQDKLEAEGLQFSYELMQRWVEYGDSALMIDSDELEEDDANVAAKPVNLILKNWLTNIARRSFGGIEEGQNEIVDLWRGFLLSPNKNLRTSVLKNYRENCNVIGATCSSIGDKKAGDDNRYTQFFHNYCSVFDAKNKRDERILFTTVIQDESSKATPAELVLPFVYGQRAIVIGDHRQLPPMLDKDEFDASLDYALASATNETDRAEIAELKDYVQDHFDEMEISHFQKLYENIDESLKGSFNVQYRMHPDINKVIEQFYRKDSGLKCGLVDPIDRGVNSPDFNNPFSRYHGIDIEGLLSPDIHVLFVDVRTPEMKDGTSRVNYGEIDAVDKILQKFAESDSYKSYLSNFEKEEDKQVGIISFYGKQIRQLRKISNKYIDSVPSRVSTVDRFQGMERNIVIVSMVRSNIIQDYENQQPNYSVHPDGYKSQSSMGFAESPNRLNVALSRAKRLLIVIGNREHFSKRLIYRELFDKVEELGSENIIKCEDL